jgi:hypothetical protein
MYEGVNLIGMQFDDVAQRLATTVVLTDSEDGGRLKVYELDGRLQIWVPDEHVSCIALFDYSTIDPLEKVLS